MKLPVRATFALDEAAGFGVSLQQAGHFKAQRFFSGELDATVKVVSVLAFPLPSATDSQTPDTITKATPGRQSDHPPYEDLKALT